MLYKKTFSVCGENHTECLKVMCERNGEFLMLKDGGAHTDQQAYRDKARRTNHRRILLGVDRGALYIKVY